MINGLIAALAMFIKDSFDALIVQAEARNRGLTAGLLDVVKYFAEITTVTIAVTALQGHNTRDKIIVLLLVTCANVGGRVFGVAVGKRFIKEKK